MQSNKPVVGIIHQLPIREGRKQPSPKTGIMADSIIKMLEKDNFNNSKLSLPTHCLHKVLIGSLAKIFLRGPIMALKIIMGLKVKKGVKAANVMLS